VQAIGKIASLASACSTGFSRDLQALPASVRSTGFSRESKAFSAKAGTTSVVLVLVLFCGCRQLQMSTLLPSGQSRGEDTITAVPATNSATAARASAQTATVYRVADDDAREGTSASGNRSLSNDGTALSPQEPNQSLQENDARRLPYLGVMTAWFSDGRDDYPVSDGGAGVPPAGVAAEMATPSFAWNDISEGSASEGTLPLLQDEANDGDSRSCFRGVLASTFDDVRRDYGNYYSRRTAVQFVAVLAPAAVLANTDLDANFAHWYQTKVRSGDTNHAAAFFRPLGNGYYTIPVYVSAKFVGEYFDDVPAMSLVGQFGDRATRALLVGAPPLLAVQYLTGAGRPNDYVDQSYWKPFHSSHGASGHAFMGAVPFLTLAGMTDDPWAKLFFYACSPWTGVSRINDNAHYLSQVWLGWWMAFLACESVNKTENSKGPIQLEPLVTPEMSGVGVVYAH
jgi:hypothetical protein